MIIDTSSYRGKVKIAIKKGNSVVNKSTHNTGLPDMAMLFAKAITGSLDLATDIPRVLDIGYSVKSSQSASESVDNGLWTSILNSPVVISGRQYKYDSTLKNWVGILTTTVYTTDLNGALINNVIENITEGNYELKIRLGSYRKNDRHWFAEINIDADFIEYLTDSTSAIITWYTELLYDESNSTNIISGDIQEINS